MEENRILSVEEVIDYIAENVDESVRDLEGVVTSLMANSMVYNREVDIEMTERVVRRAIRNMSEQKTISVEDVLEKVCAHYGVETTAVSAKTRKREVVQVR